MSGPLGRFAVCAIRSTRRTWRSDSDRGLARRLLYLARHGKPGRLGHGEPTGRRGSAGETTAMAAMDFWYDRAMRELADLNEEATELRRRAEETLPPPPAQHADEEDE